MFSVPRVTFLWARTHTCLLRVISAGQTAHYPEDHAEGGGENLLYVGRDLTWSLQPTELAKLLKKEASTTKAYLPSEVRQSSGTPKVGAHWVISCVTDSTLNNVMNILLRMAGGRRHALLGFPVSIFSADGDTQKGEKDGARLSLYKRNSDQFIQIEAYSAQTHY